MHELIKNLNLALLNVGYAELYDNWNWKEVYSPFARIYYITDGVARTYINGKSHELRAGHLYLTPPFTLHDDECCEHLSLYYIHFYETINHREPFFDQIDFPVEIPATYLDKLLVERLLEINPNRELKNIDPGVYDNISTFSEYMACNDRLPVHSLMENQGLLCYMVSRFLKSATIKLRFKDERIYKCLQYIYENINTEIMVGRLADISCVSTDHLTRIFKNELNSTPKKYINNKKIERAQMLLLTTDMPVTDIAHDLFIGNVSYFCRLFKQHTGYAPGYYRDIYRSSGVISSPRIFSDIETVSVL